MPIEMKKDYAKIFYTVLYTLVFIKLHYVILYCIEHNLYLIVCYFALWLWRTCGHSATWVIVKSGCRVRRSGVQSVFQVFSRVEVMVLCGPYEFFHFNFGKARSLYRALILCWSRSGFQSREIVMKVNTKSFYAADCVPLNCGNRIGKYHIWISWSCIDYIVYYTLQY